jgi:hypothetical protein
MLQVTKGLFSLSFPLTIRSLNVLRVVIHQPEFCAESVLQDKRTLEVDKLVCVSSQEFHK